MKNCGPINPKLPRMWHGGDYNPDQWLDKPEVLMEDVRMMKLAGCNVMSLAIFAWTALEPEEGKYRFGWLDDVMNRLHEHGIFTVLATPSGGKPAWMAEKYPEVLRVGPDMKRAFFGGRHNHCYTSPVYRNKVAEIDSRLASRYAKHPGLLLWHLSNELGGECRCELCQDAFRAWLKLKYGGNLDALNRAWWTSFWSHTYTDWTQIRAPSPLGENGVHGHNLDWRRFVTDRTVDFMKAEIAAVRASSPDIPVTTNFMGTYGGLDYWKLAPHLDVVSWDNYPLWHAVGPMSISWAAWDPQGKDHRIASDIGFAHDLNRSLKGGRPFLMMESSPSAMNWTPVMKLKRPGMHLLASIQAVAHGSDSVQYFQWRKGRGGPEKFHGAVVDHVGHENTRVFGDVADVGRTLSLLDDVVGTRVPAEAAVIFDWENWWAIDDAAGPLNDGRKRYERTCKDHYRPFWSMGIAADIVNEECDFSPYRLVIAPMLYMLKPSVADRLRDFLKSGGTLVGTYWSGIVDENDLCFTGGLPGQLRALFGIWSEEIDALYAVERNSLVMQPGNSLGMKGSFQTMDLCDLVHLEGAQELARYDSDFYRGKPALTVNRIGEGEAYYMAARTGEDFLSAFYSALSKKLGLSAAVGKPLPEGVSARIRRDEKNVFLFLMNFTPYHKRVHHGGNAWTDAQTGEPVRNSVPLVPFGVRILRAPA
jgi:beta-galactosidase